MSRLTLTLLALAAVVPPLVAQGPPAQGPIVQPPKTPPSNTTVRDLEYHVVVEGCVRGTRLEIDKSRNRLALELVDTSEFVLEGPKELMRILERDHDGHQDEIEGIAIVPGSRTREGEVTTRPIGDRTRIVAGGSIAPKDGPAPATRRGLIRLKVVSLTHLDDVCSILK
jgi:hypothetical protein